MVLLAAFSSASSRADVLPSLVIDDATLLAEGDDYFQEQVLPFTVRLTQPSSQPTVVTFATGFDQTGLHPAKAGTGSCGANEDFIAQSGTVTIPANTQAPPAAAILITTCADRSDEFDETFVVNLTSSSPAVQIADGQARGTIVDDDDPPSVGFSVDESNLRELNTGTVEVTLSIELIPRSGKTVTAQPTLSSGTAVGGSTCGPGVDFDDTNPALLTYSPGQTTGTVHLTVCGDARPEPDETFFVDLTNPTNATVRADSSRATVTIEDDDTPPVISIADDSTTEGTCCAPITTSHPMTFAVTLSREFSHDVTVQLSTANGTAVAGKCSTSPPADFVPATQTLTFPAYTTRRLVSVGVCQDALAEPAENFFLDLSNPSAGTIGIGRAIGLINDDDVSSGTFELTPSEATVRAGDRVTYTVKWTVPDTGVWRDLSTIDLRLSDERGNAIWVRWDEATNTFRLVNPAGHTYGLGGSPGEAWRLMGPLTTLDLRRSSVIGSGPTGRSVTLTLDLGLKTSTRGHTFKVEAAGADDLGHEDAFVQAGTLVGGGP